MCPSQAPNSHLTTQSQLNKRALGKKKKPLQCLELLPITEEGWESKEESGEREAVSHPNIICCNNFAVQLLVLLLLLPMTVITKNH